MTTLLIVVTRELVTKNITRQGELLQRESKDIPISIFSKDQLVNLPPPVQKYFSTVLTDGQPYITFVTLEHEGYFKTDLKKDWVPIKGVQSFTTHSPGFQWIGKTSLFTAVDQYVEGEGSLRVFLFNLFKIIEGKGKEYNSGELLRWLGESVWFPTNLLPSANLQWSPIDDQRANLTYSYDNLELSYVVTFNAKGEITQLETQRYMEDEGLTTWIGRVTEYQSVNDMKIPMEIEAIWEIEGTQHPYARFTVTKIEHF